MPMPKLDPERHFHVHLANPGHKLPMPGTRRFLPPEGAVIDSHDPYWRLCLADGSLRRGARPQPAPAAHDAPAGPLVAAAAPSLSASAWTDPAQRDD